MTRTRNGTWTATATVGVTAGITAENLKDTMAVTAKLTDIGGNVSEAGASWLIRSDTLRLVRISSEMADQTYNAGKEIVFFLEFNKPVQLKNGGNPLLNLNVTGGTVTTARYRDGQGTQNTRQYFVYNVQNNQSTTGPWLDVTGLNGLAGGNYWEAGNYPFTWISGSSSDREEIRITMNNTHIETPAVFGGTDPNTYRLRRLPVAANAGDSMFTLGQGKNIGIDTQAPTVSNIRTSNPAGDYTTGAEIFIDVNFNKPVKLANPTNPPQLRLFVINGAAGTNTTVVTDGSVKVNDRTVTFSYRVKQNDTTRTARVIVDAFVGGGITDLAGTNMAAMTLNVDNRTLNGGTSNTGSGIFINTIAPPAPVFKVLGSDNAANIISNTIIGTPNNTTVTGQSGGSSVNLQTVYSPQVWFAIEGNRPLGAYQLQHLEYSTDDGTNWKRITQASNTPFQQDVYGNYSIITRQIDRAGNISPSSNAVSFNWDPGNIVSRIDSTTPNGTYTRNSQRSDRILITVYFRKPVTFNSTDTQRITLNASNGSSNVVVTTTATGAQNSLTFNYDIGTNDSTPSGTGRTPYLDVSTINIIARDNANVSVNSFINQPADNANRLGHRKDLIVQTGALTLASGVTAPAWATTLTGAEIRANDAWTGTITLRFNRNISKGSGGTVTVTQNTLNAQNENIYRLPAVLTDAQSGKYRSARNFSTYYSRGVNGYAGGASDTSTKFILNYDQTTVVAPNDTGDAIQRLAYDFHQAETVTLPVTSQDVVVSGDTLTIHIRGSNALPVLGAQYNVIISQGFLQDSLSFRWPENNTTYTNGATTQINRPFVRVDKKVNADRIVSATGSIAMPHVRADYSGLLTTTARLDCRTPGSIVRYNQAGTEHTATQATTSVNRPGDNWRNDDTADSINTVNVTEIAETGTSGTTYDNFTGTGTATLIPIGNTTGSSNEHGYVWRISARSRNGTGGSINSAAFEEIAYRTVLTYELYRIIPQAGVGQNLSSGDQLWIRGGDAIGSSSVPGFPLNWGDDYGRLNTERRRAGARLMRMVSSSSAATTATVGTNTVAGFNHASEWRWITWEINVRTWHDVVLGRNDTITNPQTANDAWQYGPRQWAYQTGGWTALKDDYTLYPGRHRWIRITQDGSYSPGGNVKFSLQFNPRSAQTVSLTQPSP